MRAGPKLRYGSGPVPVPVAAGAVARPLMAVGAACEHERCCVRELFTGAVDGHAVAVGEREPGAADTAATRIVLVSPTDTAGVAWSMALPAGDRRRDHAAPPFSPWPAASRSRQPARYPAEYLPEPLPRSARQQAGHRYQWLSGGKNSNPHLMQHLSCSGVTLPCEREGVPW